MPIRKNPDSGIWWIDIRTPGGQRIRRSSSTKDRKAAQEYHDRLKAELWRVDKLGDAPTHSFEEACILFLKDSEGQKSYSAKAQHVMYWRTIFAGRAICSLTSDEILNALPTHRHYEHRPTVKLTAATRNRYLASIKRILSLADDAGWLTKKPKLSASKEPSVRVRWITPQQADALVQAITLPWMQDVTRFALATGARANEILSLTWDKVDLSRGMAWVTADLAKSGRARPMPLNEDALGVLKKRAGQHSRLVFTRGTDRQISQIDARVLSRACEACGIEDFHFHDLRHTWASWHVQAGTPLFVLKELGGWETVEMVKKYAHLNAGHLAEHASAVTFWSQQEAEKKKAA